MSVVYIDTTNSLAAVSYKPGTETSQNLFNDSFQASASTRTLAISRISSSNMSSIGNEAALFYEAPNGNITALYGNYTGDSGLEGQCGTWVWHNVTEAFMLPELHDHNVWLGAPVAIDSFGSSPDGTDALYVTFFDPISLYNQPAPMDTLFIINNFTNLCKLSLSPVSVLVQSSIARND